MEPLIEIIEFLIKNVFTLRYHIFFSEMNRAWFTACVVCITAWRLVSASDLAVHHRVLNHMLVLEPLEMKLSITDLPFGGIHME